MMQQVFQSQYPILEACMNRGSTVELAVAVHSAGGYPSLCSWTILRLLRFPVSILLNMHELHQCDLQRLFVDRNRFDGREFLRTNLTSIRNCSRLIVCWRSRRSLSLSFL